MKRNFRGAQGSSSLVRFLNVQYEFCSEEQEHLNKKRKETLRVCSEVPLLLLGEFIIAHFTEKSIEPQRAKNKTGMYNKAVL